MKRILRLSTGCVAMALFFGTSGFAAAQERAAQQEQGDIKEAAPAAAPKPQATYIDFSIPIFSPLFAKTPVATVHEEPILLNELVETIASAHEQIGEEKGAGRKNLEKVLRRLVNTRLILLEATNMGIDELPEVKSAVNDYADLHLREMLKQRAIRDVKPDEKLVEQLYQEAVKEWKIRSLKFDKEEDAKEFLKEVDKSRDFSAAADKAVKAGTAEGGGEGEYVKPDALLPQVGEAVSAMKPGSWSKVVPIGPSFAVIKLEDVRFPADNAEARQEAYQQARVRKQQGAVLKYNAELTKKYAKINKELLKKLDFEAPKPGLEKLSKDKRVVAQVKGEKAITVADLVQGVKDKFFHGIKSAIEEKKVNPLIQTVLDEKLTRLVFKQEAKNLQIEKSEEYKKDVEEYRKSIVFGTFIQKVVTPEVKLTEDEIKAFYNEHLKDFTTSAMAKVQGLVFTKRPFAEAAIDKLKKGTDLQWVRNNAEGQVEKEKSASLLEFQGKLLVLNSFPPQMQKILSGSKPGDVELYESPDGFFYAIVVQDLVPARTSPLEAERKQITKKIFAQKLNQSVEEWGEKLKKGYSVKIFMTGLGN